MSNRLAQSQSLYLQKHAENPINWWIWGDAAISTARKTNRPIFLSVGYSSCHWCTVMEREAFSNGEIADYLNDHFIAIKVDREEHPDLDNFYMQALQLMIGQRGWPLNVFLSPDNLIPFYGGTYFPVETRYGKPAFLKVLHSLHQLYTTNIGKLTEITAQITAELNPLTSLAEIAPLTPILLKQGILESAKVLIPKDSGASFPMMPYALAALQGSRLINQSVLDLYQICRQRSLDLSLGGIFDHVGGGFHRYTVDPTWTIPHFEKMLYDSGLILEFLGEIRRYGEKSPALKRAIELTVAWIEREMTASAGYFYAAQDADSYPAPDGELQEGAFYVWSQAELSSVLDPSELTALTQAFIIQSGGNFEGTTVLQRRQASALNERATQGLTKLFQVRYGSKQISPFPLTTKAPVTNPVDNNLAWTGRIPPVTDPKLIVAWNALTISGLAKAATVLRRADYLMLGMRAAQFVLAHQWVEGQFHRLNYDGQAVVLAQSEDYAFFVKALLDIQQACLAFESYVHQADDWLARAIWVQSEQEKWFWSEELGGYFNTARNIAQNTVQDSASHFPAHILGQERSYRDSAIPSANGIAIANLVRLSLLSKNLDYLSRAEQSLTAFSAAMAKEPLACPSLFQALDWFQNATLVSTSVELMPDLFELYLPTGVVAIATYLPEGAVGIVCKGTTCLAPATSLAQILTQASS